MLKGLWIGDGIASTGFARVNHAVIENLPTDRYEIHHLAVNYHGDPHGYAHKIYPASIGGDIYGINRLEVLLDAIKPDFIFLLNDAWVVDMYLTKIKELNYTGPIVTYIPVDAAEHSAIFYRNFNMVQKVCTYTNFGKDVILSTGSPNINEEKLAVIPHGVDLEKFYQIDKTTARKLVLPYNRLDEHINSFIVFNGNRNQPRKRIDLTMMAFREFQKDKPDARLYLHMGTVDSGIDIITVANRYGFDKKLILSSLKPHIPGVPSDRLNLIYNTADVGINTSMGEGWGLVNWEQGACGVPQIVPDFSACSEIWEKGAIKVKATIPQMFERINTVGRVVQIEDMVAALNFAYMDWQKGGEKLKKIGQDAKDLTHEKRFSWKTIAEMFDKIITEVVDEHKVAD